MDDMEIRVYLEEADVRKDFFDCKENNLKCPFCNGELVGTIGHPICRNQDCVMYDDPMPQDLLEKLIRTRKALGDTIKLAEEMLKDIDDEGLCSWQYKERLNKIKSTRTKGLEYVSADLGC